MKLRVTYTTKEFMGPHIRIVDFPGVRELPDDRVIKAAINKLLVDDHAVNSDGKQARVKDLLLIIDTEAQRDE